METAPGSLPGQVSSSLGHHSWRKTKTKCGHPTFTAGPKDLLHAPCSPQIVLPLLTRSLPSQNILSLPSPASSLRWSFLVASYVPGRHPNHGSEARQCFQGLLPAPLCVFCHTLHPQGCRAPTALVHRTTTTPRAAPESHGLVSQSTR